MQILSRCLSAQFELQLAQLGTLDAHLMRKCEDVGMSTRVFAVVASAWLHNVKASKNAIPIGHRQFVCEEGTNKVPVAVS